MNQANITVELLSNDNIIHDAQDRSVKTDL